MERWSQKSHSDAAAFHVNLSNSRGCRANHNRTKLPSTVGLMLDDETF